MTKKFQVYKCEICGNIVEVLHEGTGELVCCGQPMNLVPSKTEEPEKTEKHKPIIEANDKGVVIKVGSVPHPMEENHYIEWIEISTSKGSSKKFLKSGDTPEAKFPVKVPVEEITARTYCNLHGLWKNKE